MGNYKGRKKKKMIKPIIIIVSVLLVLLVAVGLYAGNFFYNLALNPNSDKSVVLGAPNNAIESGDGDDNSWAASKEQNELWLDSVGYEDVYMQSFDDLQLHNTVIKQEEESHRWTIVCHGYASYGTSMLSMARNFYEMGFNVMLPDARGSGESEGDYIGMGWHERLDIVAWIDEIIAADSEAEIALYGVSMGGATVMMVSGETLPDNVKVIVEDCGYSSVWDEFSYQLEEVFGMPRFPIMHFSSLVTKVRAGFWLGDGDAAKQVAKSKTPMLFFHGDADTFVPFFMLQKVYDAYEAVDVEKEMVVVEGAGHGMASAVMGDAYWEKIESFIFQYISK